MNLWGKLKLLKSANDLVKAVEKEQAMGYSIKIGLRKAGRDFLVTCAAVGGAAVAAYYADANNLAKLIGFLPDTIERAATPLLSAFLVFALNWLRERGK